MLLRQIADDKLAQYAYLVGCQSTGEALVIDPERDIDRYLAAAEAEDLTVVAVAETHIHADFLSGAREFAERYGVRVYVSDEGGDDWKYEWVHGGYEHRLLRGGDGFHIGRIEIEARHTPGHTPEHLSFLVTDRGGGADEPMGLATGDFVFVNDLGRPDLLESAAGRVGAMRPAAQQLYTSAQEFLDLQDYLQIWPGHGAGSACGKALGAVPETTVGYERRFNPALRAVARGESEFVDFILEGQPEPPLYFARMKRLNREGPPLLGMLPSPRRVVVSEIGRVADDPDAVVIDTRLDREAFFAGHLPGSLYAPFNRTFPSIVGSYGDPAQRLYLVVDEHQVEAAVRDLVRIGFDQIDGYITPAALEAYQRGGSVLQDLHTVDFQADDLCRGADNVFRLDVRSGAEYAHRSIPDSCNIAHTRLLERLDDVPRDRRIVVYCNSGGRAAAAAALLQREGRDVVHVNDVFANWERASE